MNKKFLSAILFGALMVTSTGTFVSCKDYDDDIENLQGQVDATKSDLATKVSALESSISSLQSAQSSLDSKIASTKDAAEKAALEAQAAAIAAAKADLEAAVAELKSAHDADIAEVEAAIATIKGNVEALQAFQGTTEETLEALAAADEKLAGALTELEADVVANATAIGKLEAAIDAQIKALEAYEASNDEAVAANKTAIDAVAADLKKLQDTVAGLKIADPEGLEEAAAAIAEAQGEIAKLSTAVQEINGKLELISSAVYTGVTHVSLAEASEMRDPLYLRSVEAVTDYVFGQNLPGAVTFKKGNVETFEDEIMIRVSPTNANLEKDMIKIVDSKLNNLAGLVDILEVKPYTDQLAGRAISANGLWTVRVKLVDNYDEATYRKAAWNANGAAINYAVMVNNTAVAERQVVSEYGITLGGADRVSRYDLGYSVNGTPVASIMNRWDGLGNTYTESGTAYYTTYQEAVWNLRDKTYKAEDRIYIYNNAPFITPNWTEFNKDNEASNINVLKADDKLDYDGDTEGIKMINLATNKLLWGTDYNYLYSDARSGEKALRVDAGKEFTVSMANKDNVRAYYVTLDAINAVESAPSELVAWQAYNVSGLNTVVHGTTNLKLTIPAAANGDYIGFRVYAVNYDGTLVDPDGRAFYVYVGEQTSVSATLALSMKAEASTTPVVDHAYVSSPWATYATNGWGRAADGTYTITFSADEDVTGGAGIHYYSYTNPTSLTEDMIYNYINNGHFAFVDAYGNPVTILETSSISSANTRMLEGDLTSVAADLNKVAYIKMVNVPASAMRDGVTYYATITLKGQNAQVIGSSKIAFTKELPGFPTNVAPATGMLINGNVMVFPEGPAVSGKAQFNMNGVFEGLSEGTLNLIENSANWPVAGITANYSAATGIVSVDKNYVNPDPNTNGNLYGIKNKVYYEYNYGQISNPYHGTTQTWKIAQDWKTTYPFTLQFGNYFHETTMTLTPFTITYPGAKDKEVAIDLSNIEVKDWYNQVVDLKSAVHQNVATETKEAKYLANNAEIHFVTENSAKPVDEYYKFAYFGKAEYRADGSFRGYAKLGESYNVYNAEGTLIRQYNLKMEDLDVMVVKSVKDSFTGGTVPTKIQVVYKDNFGNVIEKTSENSFTMNFQQ